MNFFIRLKHAIGIFIHYYVRPNPSQFGYLGSGSGIGIPADIKEPKNIYLYDHVNIGRRSTIMAVGKSRFVMKNHSGTAEGLIVITSNHLQKKGTFRTGGNEDNIYRDIIVEEDVWIGANVTLLPGAHIGRGAIIGAGSIIRTEVPPYAIMIGNPAYITGFKYSVAGILKHEQMLYEEKERLPKELLENNVARFKNGELR